MRNLINRFFAFANISYTMFTVRSNVKEGIRKGYEYVKWTLDFLSELLKTDFCIEYRVLILLCYLAKNTRSLALYGRICKRLTGKRTGIKPYTT